MRTRALPLVLLLALTCLITGVVTAPAASASDGWVPRMGTKADPTAYPSCRPIRVSASFEALRENNIKVSPYLKAIRRSLVTLSQASGYTFKYVGESNMRTSRDPYYASPEVSSGPAAEITVLYLHHKSPAGRKPTFGGVYQYFVYSTFTSDQYPKSYLGSSGVNANGFQQQAYRDKYGKAYLRHITLKSLLLSMGLAQNSFTASLLSYDSFLQTSLSAGDTSGLRALFRSGDCSKNPPPPAG